MFVALKSKEERPELARVLASLRRDLVKVPGITAYLVPVQNLRFGTRRTKSQYQFVLQGIDQGKLYEYHEPAGRAAPVGGRKAPRDGEVKPIAADSGRAHDAGHGNGHRNGNGHAGEHPANGAQPVVGKSGWVHRGHSREARIEKANGKAGG